MSTTVGTAYFLYDGDGWSKHTSIAEAKAAADVSLRDARDAACFDVAWPSWTEEIRIYEGFADADPSEERLECVLQATEVDICTPSSALDEDGCDSNGDWWASEDAYTCNFAMLSPKN
jgi:hypothetical protein